MIVGQEPFQYRVNAQWELRPRGIEHPDVCSVAVDSRDRVFLLTRNPPFVLIYEPDGQFVAAWDAHFLSPHHIAIGKDDSVLITDSKNHVVHRFTPDGELVFTLGSPGVHSETGAVRGNFFTVQQAGGPFNEPTKAIFGPGGEIYVSDGYFNSRVHRFAPDGRLVASWGVPGAGAGQFYLPHALAVDRDANVWVADRENHRIQVFSPVGQYLWELPVVKPQDLVFDAQGFLYVFEGGQFVGRFSWLPPISADTPPPQVSVFDPRGTLQSRWGTAEYGAAGSFLGAHGIAVDSRGDIYTVEANEMAQSTGEVIASAEVRTVQKFERIRSSSEPGQRPPSISDPSAPAHRS
jgi:DNA-binding beta-propeller fold protein YncE